MKYVNPVRRGMYPDPSVVRVGEYYYMVNSTFEYYPGISVSKSSEPCQLGEPSGSCS